MRGSPVTVRSRGVEVARVDGAALEDRAEDVGVVERDEHPGGPGDDLGDAPEVLEWYVAGVAGVTTRARVAPP